MALPINRGDGSVAITNVENVLDVLGPIPA